MIISSIAELRKKKALFLVRKRQWEFDVPAFYGDIIISLGITIVPNSCLS
jgi:hypothetical protein